MPLNALPQTPLERWLPKLVLCLRLYTWKIFFADLVAGITVGLVALPLAMAFGIASGVTPQAGIYTAVVAGFLISALGGSRTQIGGTDRCVRGNRGGIVAKFGISGLLVVTGMAGAILVIMGATGLGTAVQYIPRPVTIGFTNGIAVLIASTQIRDFFGLHTGPVPSEFLARMKVLAAQFHTLDPATTLVAVGSLAIILLWPLVSYRIPGSIVALLAGTVVVVLAGLPIDTVGSKFGGIPTGLPEVHIPPFRTDLILPLLPSALTVALLAAVESLLSAVVADGMSGDRHNSNVELIAQGVANLASPMVGGLPATGAIARTATECSIRRQDSGVRNDSRADAAGHPARRRAAGQVHSAGDTGRGAVRGGVQHGRVARNRRHHAAEPRRQSGLGRDVPAERWSPI
jgi:SulP family sulfate permease